MAKSAVEVRKAVGVSSPVFTISETEVVKSQDVNGKDITQKFFTEGLADRLSSQVPFSTGFLPPCLRMYSHAMGHEQVVLEMPPGINMVYWSQYEGGKKTLYKLAQPWRIIIAEIRDGQLIGARQFYSPRQISSLDDPLYHANVSNLNCYGYGGGLAVGWACLYHKESWKTWSLEQKIMRIIERINGGESYNFANMSETDGVKLYRENKRPKYTWDPKQWERKTKRSGLSWTLDPDMWIPVLVKGIDDQSRHDPKGEPLTLRMAVDGKTKMYYDQATDLDLGTQARRGIFPKDYGDVSKIITSAIKASPKK